MGHQYHTAVTCNPTIQDNQGSVEVISEETYNIDFFNSHTAKKSEIKEDEKPDGDTEPCAQTCAHYFSSLEVGEMISFILLGYLTIANWGRITMWIHKKWLEIRKTANERKMAKAEARRVLEKKSIRAELELERAAVESEGIMQIEAAGGCNQSGKPTDIRVDLS